MGLIVTENGCEMRVRDTDNGDVILERWNLIDTYTREEALKHADEYIERHNERLAAYERLGIPVPAK